MRDEMLAHLGRSAAGLNQEFDLGRTNLDDCKLCRDKKGVGQDQQECDEQTEGGTLHACASHLPAGWGKPQLSLRPRAIRWRVVHTRESIIRVGPVLQVGIGPASVRRCIFTEKALNLGGGQRDPALGHAHGSLH